MGGIRQKDNFSREVEKSVSDGIKKRCYNLWPSLKVVCVLQPLAQSQGSVCCLFSCSIGAAIKVYVIPNSQRHVIFVHVGDACCVVHTYWL